MVEITVYGSKHQNHLRPNVFSQAVLEPVLVPVTLGGHSASPTFIPLCDTSWPVIDRVRGHQKKGEKAVWKRDVSTADKITRINLVTPTHSLRKNKFYLLPSGTKLCADFRSEYVGRYEIRCGHWHGSLSFWKRCQLNLCGSKNNLNVSQYNRSNVI